MAEDKSLSQKLAQLEQELKDDGIDLDALGDKADELKDISLQVQSGDEHESTNWIAYCISCHKQLEACPNGAFVEAAARLHIKATTKLSLFGAHQVIVGRYMK